MSFFQKIEKLCTYRGISVAKLAAEVGRGSATATGWRKGARPQAATIKKIATYFDVSMEYLLNEDVDDPTNYDNINTSDFNQDIWKRMLKAHQYNEKEAIKAYLEFEKAQANDAMSDTDRLAIYQNNGGVVGVQGHAHAPVTISNGTERILSEQELEMLRIFSELSLIERSRVIVYAAELKEKRGGV